METRGSEPRPRAKKAAAPKDAPAGTVLRMVPKTPEVAPDVPSSPEAMLLDLLARVRGGWRPHMLVVHGISDDTTRPGAARHVYWSYGLATQLEHLGLLDLARYGLLTETSNA